MRLQCTILYKHRLFTWLLAFERYDRDGSGFLSKGELMEAMKAAGMSMASAEVSRFFQKIDKDNDDKISFKVFSGAIFSCSCTVIHYSISCSTVIYAVVYMYVVHVQYTHITVTYSYSRVQTYNNDRTHISAL